MEFSGTSDYVSTLDLTVAVNASINLERPLWSKVSLGLGNELGKTSCKFIKT